MDEGGLLYNLYKGVKFGIFPPLIFMSIGASIDFGPLTNGKLTIKIPKAIGKSRYGSYFLNIAKYIKIKEIAIIIKFLGLFIKSFIPELSYKSYIISKKLILKFSSPLFYD